MTRREALAAINAHIRKLNRSLDGARSQFSVRMCYVNAHDDAVELARKIVDELDGDNKCGA